MNSRVNLLEKAECRYQSPVNVRLIVGGMALVITSITIISFLVVSGRQLSVGNKERNYDKQLSSINSEAETLRRQDLAGQANVKAQLALRHSLAGEHVDRGSLLRVIQVNFNDQLRLKYLFVGEEKGLADGLQYSVIRLAGTAFGSGGELLPVQFKNKLASIPEIISIGGDLILKESRPEGVEKWSFVLESRRKAGGG